MGEKTNRTNGESPVLNSRFLISDMHVQNKKYANFVSVSSLTGECATKKLKFFAVLVYGHVYIIWSY